MIRVVILTVAIVCGFHSAYSESFSNKLQRLKKIEHLEKMDRDSMIELVSYLRDSNEFIQSEAMYLLGRGGRPVVPLLMKELHTDHTLQRSRLLFLLARLGTQGVLPNILSLIKSGADPSAPHVSLALLALGYLGGEKEVRTLLQWNKDPMMFAALQNIAKRDLKAFLRGLFVHDPQFNFHESQLALVFRELNLSPNSVGALLKSEEVAYVAGGLFILRKIGSGDLAPYFYRGFLHKDESVQYQALKGIEEGRYFHLLPKVFSRAMSLTNRIQMILINMISNHIDQVPSTLRSQVEDRFLKMLHTGFESRQVAAILGLGSLKSSKPLGKLKKWLHEADTSVTVKRAIIVYLGLTTPKGFESDLTPFLSSVVYEDVVIKALVRFRSEKAYELLLKKLADKKTPLPGKAEILRGLARINSVRSEGVLLSYVNHVNMRYAALDGLRILEPPYLDRLLLAFLKDPFPTMKGHAIRLLAEIKSKKAVDRIARYLSGRDPALTLTILKALGDIGDDRAAKFIRPYLSHSEQNLRETASLALKKLQK